MVATDTWAVIRAAQVGHRPGGQDHPLARREREDRKRAPDAGHGRGARRPGGGADSEPQGLGLSRVARAEGPLAVPRPVTGAGLVGQGPETCRAGAQARSRLALAEAEVRFGPHEPATEGALRTRRLEDGPDRPPVLPAGRRGPAQEGPRRPPEGFPFPPISGSQLAGTPPRNPVTSIGACSSGG